MARLVKRTPVEIPKPLPQRGQEEDSGTTLCKGADETPHEKSEPMLGRCKNCEKCAAHSWVDKLCLNCHNEASGLVFDDEQKSWVKFPAKKGKK